MAFAVHQSNLHDHVASAKPDSEPPQHLIACRSVSSHLTVSQTLWQAWGPLTQQAASADRDFNGKPFAQSEGFRFGKFSFHRVHGLLPCLVSCAHCAHAHTPKGLCAQCAQCAVRTKRTMCANVRVRAHCAQFIRATTFRRVYLQSERPAIGLARD